MIFITTTLFLKEKSAYMTIMSWCRCSSFVILHGKKNMEKYITVYLQCLSLGGKIKQPLFLLFFNILSRTLD
jgi:hypothetical protein